MNQALWTDLTSRQASHALKLVPAATKTKWGGAWDVKYTIVENRFGFDPNYYLLKNYLGYPHS